MTAMNTTSLDCHKLERLRNLDGVLRAEIRGQNQVIPRVVSVAQRGEFSLTKPGRPRGSFLLLGPTGVGKTETVIVTTKQIFGAEKLFRFDMSEFQTQESLGLLLGAKLGETGYLGAMRERAAEGSILFDEAEKAHPRVLDILLQLLDAARITVATGQTLDFSGFYIWLTSNIGSAELMGLQHSNDATLERHVLSRAQQALRPEIFARISEKLVFNRLSYEHQLEIAGKFLAREVEFLASRGHKLELDKSVLPFLVRKGFHPKLGARPMRDATEKLLGDALAECLLAGQNVGGSLCVSAPPPRRAPRGGGPPPATALSFAEQPPCGGALPPRGQPRRLRRFALAQFLHVDFRRLAALHPAKHVIDSGGVRGAAAMFADGDEVALLKSGDEFARVSSVSIFLNSHAPDGFGQGCHNAKSICCGWFVKPVSCASKRSISSWVRGIARAPHSASSLNRAARPFSDCGSNRLPRNSV
jgi:ATP-dependent Clp protease ATP-binding subunit ClpB